jgi:hypothetical protein
MVPVAASKVTVHGKTTDRGPLAGSGVGTPSRTRARCGGYSAISRGGLAWAAETLGLT